MAASPSPVNPMIPPSPVSMRMALRVSWIAFIVLLLIPFTVIYWLLWHLMNSNAGQLHSGTPTWFLIAMVYFIVAVPGSLFVRERMFKPYFAGTPVTPVKYLEGMMIVWAALAAGGLLSLIGCIVTQSLLPNLVPGLMALMFYLTLWPSGRAMTHRTGGQEDAELYEEPR